MQNLFSSLWLGVEHYPLAALTLVGLLLSYIGIQLILRAKHAPLLKQIGVPIWLDEGRHTQSFANQQYKIVGKPDALYAKGKKITAVEYKSRRGPIYDADRVQAFTAALAARGSGMLVTQVVVKTALTEKLYKLPKRDTALYRLVEPYIEAVRDIRHGEAGEANPEPTKCHACAFRASCKDRTD